MKKKNEVIKDEKYFEKKLGVHSKKKFVVGICSAAVLIGGLTASTCYFALRGGTTDKDIFLRACARLNEGDLSIKGSLIDFDASKENGEFKYSNLNVKINKNFEESDISTGAIENNLYAVMGSDSKLHTVTKPEGLKKYYEVGDDSKGTNQLFSEQLKMVCFILNDYNKYKKLDNETYFASYDDTSMYLFPENYKYEVTLKIKNSLATSVKIEGEPIKSNEKFTIIDFEFYDYNKTNIVFDSGIKNYVPYDESKIFNGVMFFKDKDDPQFEYNIVAGREYYVALYDDDKIIERFDEDSCIKFKSDNVTVLEPASTDKYLKIKVKNDAKYDDYLTVTYSYYSQSSSDNIYIRQLYANTDISLIDIEIGEPSVSGVYTGNNNIQLSLPYTSSKEINDANLEVSYVNNENEPVTLLNKQGITLEANPKGETKTFSYTLDNDATYPFWDETLDGEMGRGIINITLTNKK